MKDNVMDLAKSWSQNIYFDQEDRDELIALIESNNQNEIHERFYQSLKFGTGGLRSIIGFGANRMNKYNVRKATHAMALVAQRNKKNNFRACISYDCRQFSKEFALEAALVFCAHGFETFIFKELTPTPLLSYAVRYYEADCGIMITASHNPKQYNGFKAYWNDGAQVTPPHDQEIIDQFNDITDWNEIPLLSQTDAQTKGLLHWIDNELFDKYYGLIENEVLDIEMCKKHGNELKVVFTPLHGTGLVPCQEIAKRLFFTSFDVIESQAIFDSSFSNVETTPNPEDPKALKLAVAQMIQENGDLAYGTDPDCDRLGVVVNNKGEPYYLNGNQIGLLLLDYRLKKLKEKNLIGPQAYILKSIVTSPLQRTIGENFGVPTYDTLTGFKWMAQKILEIESENKNAQFIFASEESFGYMPYNFVRDKDAVASMALMNEVALFHKIEKRSLVDALDLIYEEYGFAKEDLISYTFEGSEGQSKINQIMSFFRNEVHSDFHDFEVEEKLDFENLTKTLIKNNTTEKIEMTSSNVLAFNFKNQTTLFLRPSGTEPKIKFYLMVQKSNGSIEEKKLAANQELTKLEKAIRSTVEKI